MSTIVQIQKRLLGKSDLAVSPIGLGVMEFAGGGGLAGPMFPVIPQEEKNAIVKAALDGGMNWFDTAELYGNGVSERSLALGLLANGDTGADVIVATKWWPLLRTSRNIPRTIGDRMRFLAPYRIGLYMVHQPYSLSAPEAEMAAMADLVAAGHIRSVGVSNYSASRMRRAHNALRGYGLPLAVNQVRYSLLHREIESNGILDTARELGVTIVAYTPLASGVLTGKYHKNPALLDRAPLWWRLRLGRELARSEPLVKVLDEIAGHYGATPAQVALNWVIHFHGDLVVTIPGATRVYQAEENAGAMRFQLAREELKRLDELSRAAR